MLKIPFNLNIIRKNEDSKEDIGSKQEIKVQGLDSLQDSIAELSTIVKDVGSRLKTIEEKTRKIESTVVSLKDSIQVHSEEIENLKKNFDKLIAIYELIANTVNPFVEPVKPKAQKMEIKEEKPVEKIQKKISQEILPLDYIDQDPLILAVVLGWLNYMVDRAGVVGTKKALEYYRDVGWITEKVYIQLLKYLRGFKSDKVGELKPEDHIVSLYFITKIKRGIPNIESYKKIYEELVERGIVEPKLG